MSDARDSAEPTNPYASSSVFGPPGVAKPTEVDFNLGKSVLVWSLVCSVSAAPSFVIGFGMIGVGDWPWMLLGVLIFIACYVIADRFTFRWPFRHRVAVKLSLFITYIIRIAASVVFPVALTVDVWCGVVSSQVIAVLGNDPVGSTGLPGPVVLIWTLSQGVVMNGVLTILWVVILGICWVVTKEPSDTQLPE